MLGDKAYSSRANRQLLRRRRITAVIPEPEDQIGHPDAAVHAAGGQSTSIPSYKGRNVVERSFNSSKQ